VNHPIHTFTVTINPELEPVMSATWNSGEQLTINQLMREKAEEYDAAPFLDFTGDVYSYRAIDQLSSAVAAGLQALGVARGDTVLSLLDNSVDAVLTWLAINNLGAVSVPTNTAYKGEFLRLQIVDSGA
jgi:crotonobetaine/carnitine-CoA ligase